MSKNKGVRLRRWAGAIAGIVVLFKSLVFVIARILRFANNEAQARGSDTAYVLGLAERRRAGRG